MSDPLEARSPEESRATYTHHVMPMDANPHGNLFGGKLVAICDTLAAVAALRHCHRNVVTASIDRVDFISPTKVGHILVCEARVTFVASRSLEVYVTVDREDPIQWERAAVCDALLTFVALDEQGRPCRVPPLALETEAHRHGFEAGRQRYEARKARRGQTRQLPMRQVVGAPAPPTSA